MTWAIWLDFPKKPMVSLSFKRSDGTEVIIDTSIDVNPHSRKPQAFKARLSEENEEKSGSIGINIPVQVTDKGLSIDSIKASLINPEGTKANATFSQACEELVGSVNTFAIVYEMEARRAFVKMDGLGKV